MPAIKFPIAVEMEGGETWTVTADQRDLAKYELQEFYSSARVMTTTRYLAYAASIRQGLTKLTWPKFDAACIYAGDVVEEAEPNVDPGMPDRHDEVSST